MARKRNSPTRVRLSNSLYFCYTISVVPSSKYDCGFFNSARFYFYSTAAKRIIGKIWQVAYKFPKKVKMPNNGDRPSPIIISEAKKQKALENLLILNADLPIAPGSMHTLQILKKSSELLPFWLTHFSSIYDLVKSAQSSTDINKKIAKVFINPEIASFDLSLFETTQNDQLTSNGHTLVSHIKKAITNSPNETTSGVKDAVKLIRYAIQRYLYERNTSNALIDDILIKESNIKITPYRKIANAMRLKSISIERYKELWKNLTMPINRQKRLALLVIIFLGLTPEEACGLQLNDFRQIRDRKGYYQLCVTHKCSTAHANKYGLEVLDDEHALRNIPLPFQIREPIKKLHDKKKKNIDSGFLFSDRNNQPFKPEAINDTLQNLLHSPENALSITDNSHKSRNKKEVDVAFQAQYYRESCRHYWRYHCGLTEGEICYLSGLVPPDTASAHYIDFNNGSMQYRMLKQIEYGIALFASDYEKRKHHRDWTIPQYSDFYSSGEKDKRASMDVHITEPAMLRISSKLGLKIYKEGDSNE